MNKKDFSIRLKQCVSSIFNDIEEQDDLFEFGIYTDQDVSTILIGYNTCTNFANQLAKHFLKENKIVSYYRWSFPEWNRKIGDENALLYAVNDELYNIIQPQEYEMNPDSFKDNVLDLLCNVLVELRDEGLFSSVKRDVILYLEKGDSYIGEKMKERIRTLVGEKYYEEFLFDMRKDLY